MPRLARLSPPNVAGERGKSGSRRRVWAVPIRCWLPSLPGSGRNDGNLPSGASIAPQPCIRWVCRCNPTMMQYARPPTCAARQIGSYLGYSGHGAITFGKAVRDPEPTSGAQNIATLLVLWPVPGSQTARPRAVVAAPLD
jgi:hypothetical protein